MKITDVQVKPIPNVEGWSAVSVKINDRTYRWDVEDEVAKELEKRLKDASL
jgi:hypothetical protein